MGEGVVNAWVQYGLPGRDLDVKVALDDVHVELPL